MNNCSIECIFKCMNEDDNEKQELSEDTVFACADFFKVFGDSTRFRILYALKERELCAGDIAERVKMSASAVSHQLKVLRVSNFVKTRRDGKEIYYSLADEHVEQIIACGIEHILEEQ